MRKYVNEESESFSFCFAGESMRDFAETLYKSRRWQKVRKYIYKRDAGLCVRCGAIGEAVHHRQPITPATITDPFVTLAEDNLELLCRECHSIAHSDSLPTDPGLTFDAQGNLVERFVKL